MITITIVTLTRLATILLAATAVHARQVSQGKVRTAWT